MKTIRMTLIAAAVAMTSCFAIGCGPNDAEQQKTWNANVDEVQKYSSKYAGFKTVLDGRLAEAQKTFDEGKALSDKEARANKMKEANDRMVDLLAPFDAYEKTAKELSDLEHDKDIMNLPAGKVNPALEAAKAATTKADSIMKSSHPANAGEAKDEVKSATTALSTAETTLKSLKPAPTAAPAPPPAATTAKKK